MHSLAQNEWTNSYFDNLEFISEGGEAKFFRGNLKESVYRRLIRTEASRTMGIKVFRYGDAEHWRRAVVFLSNVGNWHNLDYFFSGNTTILSKFSLLTITVTASGDL